MTLGEVIDAYVALQSARGVSFEGGRALLSQFRREMGNPPIDYVCAEAVVNFLQGSGALSATWLLKHRVPSGLYRFAIGRGHVDKSPLPVAIPKLPLQQTPYVYSNDELRRTRRRLCMWPIARCGPRCTDRFCCCFTAAAYASVKPFD
jgi:hypothetical protein